MGALENQVESLKEQLNERRAACESLEAELSAYRARSETTPEALKIPALWRERQNAVSAGSQSAKLREQLDVMQKDLASRAASDAEKIRPIAEELNELRNSQTKHMEGLAERDELWKAERRRMTDEVEAMAERVGVIESAVQDHERLLADEAQVMARIRDRMKKREEDRETFLAEEVKAFETQKQIFEEQAALNIEAQAAITRAHEEERTRITGLHKKQAALQEREHHAIREEYENELESLREQVLSQQKMVDQYSSTAKRSQDEQMQMEGSRQAELNEVRSELHHLRRITTERQLELANEKQTLLAELERARHGDLDEAAADLGERFLKQFESLHQASEDRDKLAQEEIDALHEQIADLQRIAAERGEEHEAEMKEAHRRLEIVSQLERERERVAKEENNLGESLVCGA